MARNQSINNVVHPIENGCKQIERRLKISGAQWNSHSVNKMLRLRCAYLNGQLAA